MPIAFQGVKDFLDKVGEDLGASEWLDVTQERVDQFADATGDHQWIHVDPGRAAAGPFGGTVAHGFLTLSLAPQFLRQIVAVEGVKMGVNYGLDRVRFTNPVRVGSRLRLRARLASAEEVEPDGVQATYELTFETEGEEKPACVAQTISRYYF